MPMPGFSGISFGSGRTHQPRDVSTTQLNCSNHRNRVMHARTIQVILEADLFVTSQQCVQAREVTVHSRQALELSKDDTVHLQAQAGV